MDNLSNRETPKQTKDRSITLIILCWLVYTCSYVGKLGYTANIIQIENLFEVSHASAGMVSTFFFFSYGAGQIINGLFCKKYNLKYFVFGALIVSAACNLMLGLLSNFTIIKYVWLINGFSLSVLWPSLIRFLSENVSEKHIKKAIIAMGTTVATGTVIVYASSALFVFLGAFKTVFYMASGLLPSVGILWLLLYPKKGAIRQTESNTEIKTERPNIHSALLLPIAVLAFFAIFNNLTKDGLTTWVPSILNDRYSLDAHFSILLTLLLPILAIFGVSVAINLNKKIKDLVDLTAVLFGAAALLIGIVLIFMDSGAVLPLISLGLVSMIMSAANNVITSMAPLMWKKQVNSGMLAGVLDGFCYVGSAVSSYGLGLVADNGGWDAVFILLLSATLSAVVLDVVYHIIRRVRKKAI